jgi:hypothetical protein
MIIPRKRSIPALLGALSLSLTAAAATPDQWTLPVAVQKLDNGLTVIVSEDHTSPSSTTWACAWSRETAPASPTCSNT